MADFLGRVVRMLTAVVMQRFDQRRAGRHGGFSSERVIGETHQIMRAIEQSLGDQMRHLERSRLVKLSFRGSMVSAELSWM
jgi:hypothetical protein